MPRGSQEFFGLPHAEDTNFAIEGGNSNISDGMELIDDGMGDINVPKRMTGEQFRVFMGNALPEGISTDILDDDIIELEQ